MAPNERTETVERKDKIQSEIEHEPRDVLSRGFCDSRLAMERRLALLQQLEASLVCSHRALAALDLDAIERGTRDQLMLCRGLGLQMRRMTAAGGADAMENPELLQEVRNSGWKVLRAARLQAALLKRAQRKLMVIANMLAGSERNYAAPLARHNRLRFAIPAENRG